MPRAARKKSKTNIYHVVVKGVANQIIFEERKDFEKYIEILDFHKSTCHFKLFAYCLMSNHTHILLQITDTSLETIFRKINTHYAVWFNMKYGRSGHLQGDRFYSEPINDIHHLFCAIKYIHLNPTKAGLEPSPGQTYQWSSIHEYTSNKSKLVDTDDIPHIFDKIELINYDSEAIETFLDIDNIRKRIPDDVARNIIYDECNLKNLSEFALLALRKRNHYINKLHSLGISIRQLSRLTGVPKGVIQNVLVKYPIDNK